MWTTSPSARNKADHTISIDDSKFLTTALFCRFGSTRLQNMAAWVKYLLLQDALFEDAKSKIGSSTTPSEASAK